MEGKLGSEKEKSVVGKSKSLSQSYAIAVTFSHAYNFRHPERTFFPSIQISPHFLKVFIYDNQKDIMVAQSFRWSSGALLVLWAVVNYSLFLNHHAPEQLRMRFLGAPEPWNYSQGFEVAHNLHFLREKRAVISTSLEFSYDPLYLLYSDVVKCDQ